MTASVAFQNLSLGYDDLRAVRQVETDIAEGSLTAIVGPNGAGKSTLLKGVTGILSPIEGKIELNGFARDNIAYLPQQSDIDRSFPINVLDLVAMGLWREVGSFGWLGREQRHRVTAAIAAVGLTGLH